MSTRRCVLEFFFPDLEKREVIHYVPDAVRKGDRLKFWDPVGEEHLIGSAGTRTWSDGSVTLRLENIRRAE